MQSQVLSAARGGGYKRRIGKDTHVAEINELTIPRPDDWHLHLRDGAVLEAVLPYTARQFARAIVMPNLVPPVTTTADAVAYRDRILDARPGEGDAGASFTPLMTVYLTDRTDPDDLARGHNEGLITAVKLYPAGATTNSDAGVTDIRKTYSALERMQAIGMPLLIHGEVTDSDVDIFDREAVFIDRVLSPLLSDFPELKVVLEHTTTAHGTQFVAEAGPNIAATITPHHLLINRSHMFEGGIRPHRYCLPVAKRERDRQALLAAATSDNPRFFLGTDSAPHAVGAKESACGCAGIFCAVTALELYAHAFEAAGALDRLEAFASRNGPAFYGLPVNAETVTLSRQPRGVPERIYTADGTEIRPFRAGQELAWRMT